MSWGFMRHFRIIKQLELIPSRLSGGATEPSQPDPPLWTWPPLNPSLQTWFRPDFDPSRTRKSRVPVRSGGHRSGWEGSVAPPETLENTIVTTSITDRQKFAMNYFLPFFTGPDRKIFQANSFDDFWPHYWKHLADDRSDDTRTKSPWTKSCNGLPDENSPRFNSVILDRNITGEIS